MVAFSRIRIQGVGWIDPVSLAMLLDVCIYVLCMYGSSLWVYTRPRAGLNSIGLRGVLAFEVCPATSRSNCHSHQVVNFFSFSFKYFPHSLWEVNFLFVNVVWGGPDLVVSRRMWSLWKFENIFKLLLDWIHLEMMQLWWPGPSFRFSFWSQRLIFWGLLQN